MDENWDEPAGETVANGFTAADSGRAFSRGRGFSTVNETSAPGNGGWDDNADTGYGKQYNGNGDDSDQGDSGSHGRGRGRGGRGGRGFRGGRGGFRGGRDDFDENGGGDSWGDNNNDDGGGRGRGGRGRGRGGDRGGRGGFRGDNEGRSGYRDDNNENKAGGEEKKRENYIPPEPTNDEAEMFQSGNTTGINFMKYDNIDVKVTGENIPPPINSFEQAGLRSIILDNVKKSGYTKPTPIQKNAIPIIMNSRDLMGCAQTGSGKTAAFLVPIIHTLISEERDLIIDGTHVEPQAVIISPTRELAIQIAEQARKFARSSIIKVCILYGGTSVIHQKSKIMSGCHILVATPGRLKDFVDRGHLSFNSTRFVVLDEADRMLDMGFLPCVEEVMTHDTMTATGERNTLMFSATFPEEIQHLAGKFLQNYIFVAVGIVGGACSDVEQKFYQVDKFKKRQKLLDILNDEGTTRTLVFVETKRNADFLATFLSENIKPTTSIHGDRLQREREQALNDFKHGIMDILVATGVAARGLDIKDVQHVINFDLPKNIDEYVHRIGRTGRVGNRGKATSFFDDSIDGPIAGELVKILKQADQALPDWLEKGGRSGGYYQSSKFGGKDVRGDNFGEAQDFSKNPVEEADDEW